MRNVNYLRLLSDQAHPLFVFCRCVLGKPLFEMCWFYMGIAQIALDPPPPLSNRQTWNKSAPKHPDKPLHPSHPLKGNAHKETTHFKCGFPYLVCA